MSAGLVSSEASLLGLQMAPFLLPLYMAVPLCAGDPVSLLFVQISFSYQDTHQPGLGPTLMSF